MKTNIIRQFVMIILPAIMRMGMLTSCDVDRMARGWKARILQAMLRYVRTPGFLSEL